ncbi:hypothetical protein ELQ92_00440 [Labedella populi]|uniref:DUF1684 domain-containing protein n=1 Tax=Labedella populi TaxID=2498850 RepID=A0A444QDX8_9MICO|nr:hypothetical protein [Labedella populi]RWZ67782.1 hypothetical protein ELQ92_00440 [Labedella populi]
MKRTRHPISAAAAVVLASLALSGCAAAPDDEPTAIEKIGDRLEAFEDRLDRIMWSRPSPESLWYQLDPATGMGNPVLAADFAAATMAPHPFAHEVRDDLLTVDVFVSALTRPGGSLFPDASHAYLCASYVIDPYHQSFVREQLDCPVGPSELGDGTGAVVALDDLALDPA